MIVPVWQPFDSNVKYEKLKVCFTFSDNAFFSRSHRLIVSSWSISAVWAEASLPSEPRLPSSSAPSDLFSAFKLVKSEFIQVKALSLTGCLHDRVVPHPRPVVWTVLLTQHEPNRVAARLLSIRQ